MRSTSSLYALSWKDLEHPQYKRGEEAAAQWHNPSLSSTHLVCLGKQGLFSGGPLFVELVKEESWVLKLQRHW